MTFESYHFISTLSPKEKLKAIGLLKEFDPGLLTILEAEVGFGNQIINVQQGWPSESNLCVSLIKPFHRVYEILDVQYETLDIHY